MLSVCYNLFKAFYFWHGSLWQDCFYRLVSCGFTASDFHMTYSRISMLLSLIYKRRREEQRDQRSVPDAPGICGVHRPDTQIYKGNEPE